MGLEELLGAFIRDVCNVVPPAVRDDPDKRWSLGEYGLIANPPARFLEICNELSANDFDQLERNFVRLPPETPCWDRKPIRSRAAFGLYLLVLFASLARDHAADGTLWPKVRGNLSARLIRRDDVVSRLFEDQQPSALAKELIREAVGCFRLRNMLHGIEVQRWYTTLMLQYGFSQTDWSKSAQDWLRGVGRPQSACMLLGQTEHEESLRRGAPPSDSFTKLWTKLQAYHRGRMSNADALVELVALRWFSDAQAKETLRSLDSSRTALPELTADEGAKFGVGHPHIVWRTGSAPVCVVQLKLPPPVDSDNDCYAVMLHQKSVAKIYRDVEADAWKHSVPDAMNPIVVTATWIARPLTESPWAEPTLCTESGEVIDVFCLANAQGHPEDVPLVLYPWAEIRNGTGWAPGPVPQNPLNILLLLPPHLATARIDGAEIRENYRPQADTGWRVVRLSRRNQDQLRLTDGDEELWSFNFRNDEPVGATVALRVADVIGRKMVLHVEFSGPARLVAAEVGGVPCEVRVGAFVAPLSCFGTAGRTVTARMTVFDLETQRQFIVRREISYPLPCLLVLEGTEFVRHRHDAPLHINASTQLRLHVPKGAHLDLHTPFLTEASAPIMSAKSLVRTQTGTRLNRSFRASGAALIHQQDLLNSQQNGAQPLASYAVWTGALTSHPPRVESLEGALRYSVTTTERLEPRADWRLELLAENGCTDLVELDPRTVEADLLNEGPPQLKFRAAAGRGLELANIVALRLRGSHDVLGMWSVHDPLAKLATANAQDLWKTLQHWALPIDATLLRSDPRIVSLMQAPKQFLAPSKSDWGGGEFHSDVLARHEMLVSILMWDWRPQFGSAAEVCEAVAISPGVETKRIERQFLALSVISPWLARNVLAVLDQEDRDVVSNQGLRERRERIASFLRQRGDPGAMLSLEEAGAVFAQDYPLDVTAPPRSPVARFVPNLDPQFLLQMIADASRAGTQNSIAQENMKLLHNLTRQFGRSPQTKQYCFGPLAASMLLTL